MNGHIFTRTDGTENVFERRARSETFREFLRWQSRGEATRAQIVFDIAVGLVLPVICLVFDPIVFRSGFISGRPLAGQFQLFAYGFIAVEIIALAVWLSIGSRAAEWCGVLAGIMFAGALFSFVIGVCLLPFSLFGLLLVLMGALGFTPFLTAFIYLRNARRALKAARTQMPRTGLFVTLLFGATLAAGAPAFAHWRIGNLIQHSLMDVLDGDDARADAAARRLRPIRWLAAGELDQMVWSYGKATDPQRRERLARSYRQITGDDIETRLSHLYD
jgi:hypothetical protein